MNTGGHSPIYWIAMAGVVILLLLDIYNEDPKFTTVGALVCGVVAVLARPGGPLGGKAGST